MGKKFSGIFSSRLWEAYKSETRSATLAFVTDIGNDLAYEEPVERIMQWVAACACRLADDGAHVALTNVPIAGLRALSRARFEFFRMVLFPNCRLPWATLLARAEDLHERLAQFAEVQKMPIFSVPNAWYGWDPIHPRSRHLGDYWRALMGLLVPADDHNESRRRSLRAYLRIRTLSTPDVRCQLSTRRIALSRAVLKDGSRVALY